MTKATLYIAVDCPTVADARTMLDRLTEAGLNTDHPTVHVAIGDPKDDE